MHCGVRVRVGAAARVAYCLSLACAKDPEGIDWLKESIESYAWARANTKPGDEKSNPAIAEPRMFAAAALFRMTGVVKCGGASARRASRRLAEDTSRRPGVLPWTHQCG